MQNVMKETWASGGATIGSWISLPIGLSAEIASRSGFDYVCVDQQHGLIDRSVLPEMMQAIELGSATPLVRVQINAADSIGIVLDAGAAGVIIPMVNSAEQAHQAVAACRYAPQGSRSYGPIRPLVRNAGYTPAGANEAVACIPMVETTTALNDLDGILGTPGVDAVYVGPADLSLTLGLPPRNNDGEAAFDEALERIVSACQNAGVVPGCHTTADLVDRRLEQGFRMITAVADAPLLKQGFAAAAKRFGRAAAESAPASGY